MICLGVNFSTLKTHKSKYFFEFAKKLICNFTFNCSPFPIQAILASGINIFYLYNALLSSLDQGHEFANLSKTLTFLRYYLSDYYLIKKKFLKKSLKGKFKRKTFGYFRFFCYFSKSIQKRILKLIKINFYYSSNVSRVELPSYSNFLQKCWVTVNNCPTDRFRCDYESEYSFLYLRLLFLVSKAKNKLLKTRLKDVLPYITKVSPIFNTRFSKDLLNSIRLNLINSNPYNETKFLYGTHIRDFSFQRIHPLLEIYNYMGIKTQNIKLNISDLNLP